MKTIRNRSSIILISIIFLLGFFLRVYNVSQDPPGLYIDEVAIGVDAYSIFTTGRDQYGIPFPLWFQSVGDYKMPIYVYAVSASMAVFGKTEFAIRFPSVLAGSLTVLVMYFFLSELLTLSDKKFQESYRYLPMLASFLLAISSWHIHFSRGGFEVNLGVFLYLVAAWLSLLFWTHKNAFYLYLSFLTFVATIYTYFIFRAITPITLVILTLFFFFSMKKMRKSVVSIVIVCLIILAPLIIFSLTPEGNSRFSVTSAFGEYPTDSFLLKIFLYPMVYIKDYLSFFSFDFLFSFGDGIGRHQIVDWGVLYRWQFPFLLIGLYQLIRQKKNIFIIIIFALLILAPIPAAVARPSPHTLRSLLMVIPMMTIIAVGIIAVFNVAKKYRWMYAGVLAVIVLYSFTSYLHYYYIHYPRINSLDWGAGYKEIVEKTETYKTKYDKIVIDSNIPSITTYLKYYGPDIKYALVKNNWVKPKEWDGKKVLYIRPYYGQKKNPKIIDDVYLPTINQDVFAQFWKE